MKLSDGMVKLLEASCWNPSGDNRESIIDTHCQSFLVTWDKVIGGYLLISIEPYEYPEGDMEA